MTDEELRQLLAGIYDEPPSTADAPQIDSRFDDLAAGALSEQDAAALHKLAALAPETADALEAFEPLDPELLERTTDRLMAMRPAEPAPVQIVSARAVDEPGEDVRGGVIVSLLSWLKNPRVLAPLAMAATLILMVGRLPVEDRPGEHLSAYVLEDFDGDKLVRGSDPVNAATPAFAIGSAIDAAYVPEDRVLGPLNAAVWVETASGPRPTGLLATPLQSGTVRIKGVVGTDLVLDPGTHTLIFAVASGQPIDAALLTQLEPGRNVAIHRAQVEIRAAE